jgi:hypothetical protein
MVEEPSHVKKLSFNHVCKIGLNTFSRGKSFQKSTEFQDIRVKMRTNFLNANRLYIFSWVLIFRNNLHKFYNFLSRKTIFTFMKKLENFG